MTTELKTWPGLISNASPHDLPTGAAQTQENFQALVPGKLQVRGGLQAHTFSPDLTALTNDAYAMYTWNTVRGIFVAILDSAGTVYVAGQTSGEWSIETNVPTDWPSCWCEARDGKLIRVDGLGRGTIYNEDTAWKLGIFPPPTPPTVGTTADTGNATAGDYICTIRYLDVEGIPSSITTTLTEVTASEDDQFDWSWVETDVESRVTHVELYRSTADQTTTLYKVTTVAIGAANTHTDTLSDDALALLDALPVLNPDGSANSRRFVPPPMNMRVVCPFQDRYFYTVPTVMLLSAFDDLSEWGDNQNTAYHISIGRGIYREGEIAETITAIAAGGATVTLSISGAGIVVGDLINDGALIGPAPSERNMIYYSETDEPESVPTSQNTIIVQENTDDNDWLTGMLAHGSICWVFKERHTYRFTFVRQPIIDAGITLAYSRGCINPNCARFFEDICYVMDQFGCWALEPGGYEPISEPIQDYFRDETIDWTNKEWFFVSVEPNERVVRFHVQFSGDSGTRPKRALCFSIRTRTWWTELYQQELGGTCLIEVDGLMRTLVGGESGDVLLMNEGTSDEGSMAISATYVSALLPIPEDEPDDGDRALLLTFTPTTGAETIDVSLLYDHESTGQTLFTDPPIDGMSITPEGTTVTVDMQVDRSDLGNAPGYQRIPYVAKASKRTLSHRFVSAKLACSQSAEALSVYALGFEEV